MSKDQDILEAADLIERFVAGTCGPYEWDDFLNGSRKDSEIQKIRGECEQVEIGFSARSNSEWCSQEGGHALLGIAIRLRDEIARSDRGSDQGTQSARP